MNPRDNYVSQDQRENYRDFNNNYNQENNNSTSWQKQRFDSNSGPSGVQGRGPMGMQQNQQQSDRNWRNNNQQDIRPLQRNFPNQAQIGYNNRPNDSFANVSLFY